MPVLAILVVLAVVLVALAASRRARGPAAEPAAAKKIEDPAALKAALEDAVRRDDLDRVVAIARLHEDEIVARFPTWARRDPALGPPARGELDAYVHFLGTLADVFARVLGRQELWDRLSGGADNPIVRWEKELVQASALVESARYDEAITQLEATLARVKALSGNAVDALLPKTLGQLAVAYFHLGRAQDALPVFERALALCRDVGDREGVRVYHRGLFEALRWLGRGAEAAEHANRLAELLSTNDPEEARFFERQGRIVAAGEPRVRVIARLGRHRYELDDLPEAAGGERISLELHRDRLALGAGGVPLRRGQQLAAKGELESALVALAEAGEIDPHDPQPHYESGVALLELGRSAEALAAFEQTEALAPGWFLCRQYRWLAREQLGGRLGAWSFGAVRATLDDATTSPDERVRVAREALERASGFAWMHVSLARARRRAQPKDTATIEREVRAALPSIDEPCFRAELTFELAITLDPDSDERAQLLLDVVRIDGTPMASAAAKLVRQLG